MKFTFNEFLALQSATATTSAAVLALADGDHEAFEERAAILEFCTGLSRIEAERQALAMIHPEAPPPD